MCQMAGTEAMPAAHNEKLRSHMGISEGDLGAVDLDSAG